jgi:alpha-L-rhamnosidase
MEIRVFDNLVSNVTEKGAGHFGSGIYGTSFLPDLLSDYNGSDIAYMVLSQKTYPSFGDQIINHGATTTWEQWDGEGSRNHPMFGGGIVWFYRKLAGMNADPEYPGYRNIIFKPQPADDVSFASYANQTPFGQASVRWEKNNGKFIMNINVPVGSTGIVYVPASSESGLTESGKPIGKENYISFLGMENGYARLKVGSGKYFFEAK